VIAALVVQAHAVGVGTVLDVVGGDLTFDESWSPYVQGRIVVPVPDAASLAALDVRERARVRVRMARRFSTTFTLADIDDLVNPTEVADYDPWVTGHDVAYLGEQLSTPYNASGFAGTVVRRANLAVLDASTDWAAGQTTVELASDEALAQLTSHTTQGVRHPTEFLGFPDTLTAVQEALRFIGAHAETVDDDAVYPLTDDAASWEPGVSIWDYADPLVQQAGLRLWADEHRHWRLFPPMIDPTGPDRVVGPEDVVRIDDVLSARQGWAEAVIVTYRWADPATGESLVQWDIATAVPYPYALRHVQYNDRAYPGPGAAAALLARARARGHQVVVTAALDPAVSPGDTLIATDPAATEFTGPVSAVRFDLAAAEMTITSRDIIADPAPIGG
jgi:hypothetical protein